MSLFFYFLKSFIRPTSCWHVCSRSQCPRWPFPTPSSLLSTSTCDVCDEPVGSFVVEIRKVTQIDLYINYCSCRRASGSRCVFETICFTSPFFLLHSRSAALSFAMPLAVQVVGKRKKESPLGQKHISSFCLSGKSKSSFCILSERRFRGSEWGKIYKEILLRFFMPSFHIWGKSSRRAKVCRHAPRVAISRARDVIMAFRYQPTHRSALIKSPH